VIRGLRSRDRRIRAAWLAGLVLATFVLVGLAAVVSDFPPGYGGKQGDSASELARRSSEWSALRRGTARDLFPFIPSYLLWGLAMAGMVRAARSTERETSYPAWVRLAKAPRTLVCAILGFTLADVVETVLFRISLTRLIDTDGAASIESLTRVTQVFFVLKFIALAIALALLAFQVLTSRGIAEAAVGE
jgi:hypothetical protein